MSVADTFGEATACAQCIQHLDKELMCRHRTGLGLAGGNQLVACASFQPKPREGPNAFFPYS